MNQSKNQKRFIGMAVLGAVGMTALLGLRYGPANVGARNPASPASQFAPEISDEEIANYRPSDLVTMETAETIFKTLKRKDPLIPADKRALLWGAELEKNYGLKSQHVFLLFTEKFRNTYTHAISDTSRLSSAAGEPFKWQSHSALLVLVGDQEIVFDPQYFEHPAPLQKWNHYFLSIDTALAESGITTDVATPRLTLEQSKCPLIRKQGDLAKNDLDEWCMTRKLPMYYSSQIAEAAESGASTDAPKPRVNSLDNNVPAKLPPRTGFEPVELDSANK